MKLRNLSLILLLPLTGFAAEPAKVYRSSVYPASFRYTSTWEPVASQASSTLVLLYERSGTGATANLSAIKADQKSITDYTEKYFAEVFGKSIPGFKLRSLKYVDTITGKMAKLEYDFILTVQDEKMDMTSMTAIRLDQGIRYMLVVNCMKERISRVRADAEVMFGTFLNTK
jgi:hypothetical protein